MENFWDWAPLLGKDSDPNKQHTYESVCETVHGLKHNCLFSVRVCSLVDFFWGCHAICNRWWYRSTAFVNNTSYKNESEKVTPNGVNPTMIWCELHTNLLQVSLLLAWHSHFRFYSACTRVLFSLSLSLCLELYSPTACRALSTHFPAMTSFPKVFRIFFYIRDAIKKFNIPSKCFNAGVLETKWQPSMSCNSMKQISQALQCFELTVHKWCFVITSPCYMLAQGYTFPSGNPQVYIHNFKQTVHN